MRRWRSAFSSVSIIFMLFVVGTAMAPTIENVPAEALVEMGAIEMREVERAGPDSTARENLLPWPEDFCLSPCAEPPPEPNLNDSSWKPTTSTTSTTIVRTPAAPQPKIAAPPPAPRPVEEWRSLVSSYFAATDVDKALAVISCESGGDPNALNPSSGAAGLFQHIPRYWPSRAAAIGLPDASIFDPIANVAAAALLVYTEGWSPWNASAGCW